jgi:hypothetical protein
MATTDLTSGSAQDAIKALLQTSYDRSNSLFGKSEGLSPEALSAFRTEATSGIQNQYDSAARALTSDLLRRGAVGGGSIPSSGGDISRAFQPLYTAREAAKTKAQRDTILADEAAKRESLQQNNALSMTALGTAGNFANTLADIEPASVKNLLLTALLSGATGGGGGPLGSLITGTGTNDTGSHGILGDLLGKIPGVGGSTGNPSTEDILKGIMNGSNDTTPPYAGTPTETVGNEAARTAPDTAKILSEILGPTAATALGTGIAGAGTIAAGIGTPSIIGQVGTTAAELAPSSGGFGSAAVGLLTNPVTAVVAAAVLGAIAWVKSQAHWEANTWTKGYQKPFDDKMAEVQQKANQLKATGQMTPEVAAQIQSGAKEALDKYQQDLDKFYREKGTNSDQSRVAAQAYQTFLKYYGQGGQQYLNQLVA